MHKSHKIILLIAIVIVSGILINATQQDPDYKSEEKKVSLKNINDSYTIRALKIPDNLSFAGERVPLERHDVKERIDRELLVNTYWQSNALLWFKKNA